MGHKRVKLVVGSKHSVRPSPTQRSAAVDYEPPAGWSAKEDAELTKMVRARLGGEQRPVVAADWIEVAKQLNAKLKTGSCLPFSPQIFGMSSQLTIPPTAGRTTKACQTRWLRNARHAADPQRAANGHGATSGLPPSPVKTVAARSGRTIRINKPMEAPGSRGEPQFCRRDALPDAKQETSLKRSIAAGSRPEADDKKQARPLFGTLFSPTFV